MTSEIAQELPSAVDLIAQQLQRIEPVVARHKPSSEDAASPSSTQHSNA